MAAELTCEANDVHQLQPMLEATATTLTAAGIDERPETALADSGSWSIDNVTTIPNALVAVGPVAHRLFAVPSPWAASSPRMSRATALAARSSMPGSTWL